MIPELYRKKNVKNKPKKYKILIPLQEVPLRYRYFSSPRGALLYMFVIRKSKFFTLKTNVTIFLRKKKNILKMCQALYMWLRSSVGS